jgi:hypothetical protein
MRSESQVTKSVKSLGLTSELANALMRRMLRESRRLEFDYFCAEEGHGDVDVYGIVFVDIVTGEPVIVKSVSEAEEVLAGYRAQLKKVGALK